MLDTPSNLFSYIWVILEEVDIDNINEPPDEIKREALALISELIINSPFNGEAALNWANDDCGRLILLACALDEAHEPLTRELPPSLTTNSTWLCEARMRYLRKSRINTNCESRQLILRKPLWGRWAASSCDAPEGGKLTSFFENLILLPKFVPATASRDRCISTEMSMSFELCRLDTQCSLPSDKPWRVGFAPIAQERSDIVINTFKHNESDWYDVIPADFSSRIDEVIEKLCSEGCHVIALPEMILYPETEAQLRRSIRKYGPKSNLCLVLAGTCRIPSEEKCATNSLENPPSNRAQIIDVRGQTILRQDKISCWDLSFDQCNRFDLNPPTSGRLKEYIATGNTLEIKELASLGRIGVLVCEDLDRTQPGQWLRHNMLLELQFVPVLDAPLQPNAWAATSGSNAAFTGGCRVIVANSLPLAHRQNDANRASQQFNKILTTVGIGMMIDRHRLQARSELIKVPIDQKETVMQIGVWDPDNWEASIDIS